MTATAETICRHELIGRSVTVVSSSDPTQIGFEGEVVMETTRMLGIENEGRVRHVPKERTTFEWALPSGERVRTDGAKLVARPARRTEQTGDSQWR